MSEHASVFRQTVATSRRNQIIDVTEQVAQVVRDSRVEDGVVVVFVPHTTAGITINENADPDVKHDLLAKLERLVPREEAFYDHAEGNSDSHVKTALVGNSVNVIIEDRRLVLGTWQGIYFCEFDGPRQRQLLIKIVAG